MTYICIRNGFVYLAVILDLFAHRAIGYYGISHNIDTALRLEALQMTIAHRNPPKGVIHHSDRGVQISMSRKGNPYDNAPVESFFKTLKT